MSRLVRARPIRHLGYFSWDLLMGSPLPFLLLFIKMYVVQSLLIPNTRKHLNKAAVSQVWIKSRIRQDYLKMLSNLRKNEHQFFLIWSYNNVRASISCEAQKTKGVLFLFSIVTKFNITKIFPVDSNTLTAALCDLKINCRK